MSEQTSGTATGAAVHGAKDGAFDERPNPASTVNYSRHEQAVPQHTQNGMAGVGRGPQLASTSDQIEVVCGPLLNYRFMTNDEGSTPPMWHGSVLVVTTPGQNNVKLSLRCLGRVDIGDDGPGGSESALPVGTTSHLPDQREFEGVKLYEDTAKAFWRFRIDVPIQRFEAKWEYAIPRMRQVAISEDMPIRNHEATRVFVVPSAEQSFRIMFHSCNGFSVGTDMKTWQGPSLWNDVMRLHQSQPFHVMIGGGDQIYNDGVRVDGPLKAWTAIGNPHKRRQFPFGEEMRSQCDEYYYKNYVRWYGTEPFKTANAQIAQINIWDDHDIIDGFGSYTDRFMRCGVFRGIGGVAQKYYLLFQHHLAPPKSTYTTDAPKTTDVGLDGTPADAHQLKDTWVLTGDKEDPQYIIGTKPGPYVEERSRNIYCRLGARMAFLGIDARTERTRHQINYEETYDLIFKTLDENLQRNPNIKHLILLLGVPIAYPRLQWLENIFSSPIMGPIKFLNKRFGVAGGLFNQFDGNVDLLDDLDDHYTAHQHKRERRTLIHRLQEAAKKHSVRVTILGGDVHLAAIGRFYSNPKLGIPIESDWRYMPNIISSAITNKPPPAAVANLLARRNKVHHLDHDTDETLLEIFNKDPGMKDDGKPPPPPKDNANGNGNENGENEEGHHFHIKKKTAEKNRATMPSRNFAIIAESHTSESIVGANTGAHTNGTHPESSAALGGAPGGNGEHATNPNQANGVQSGHGKKANPRLPIHVGEQNAGTLHPAASGLARTELCGKYGLDVTVKVEISPADTTGKTEGYGFSIPALESKAYQGQGTTW